LSLDIGLKMQKKYPLTVLLHLRWFLSMHIPLCGTTMTRWYIYLNISYTIDLGTRPSACSAVPFRALCPWVFLSRQHNPICSLIWPQYDTFGGANTALDGAAAFTAIPRAVPLAMLRKFMYDGPLDRAKSVELWLPHASQYDCRSNDQWSWPIPGTAIDMMSHTYIYIYICMNASAIYCPEKYRGRWQAVRVWKIIDARQWWFVIPLSNKYSICVLSG
jgi:hypothetical protein